MYWPSVNVADREHGRQQREMILVFGQLARDGAACAVAALLWQACADGGLADRGRRGREARQRPDPSRDRGPGLFALLRRAEGDDSLIGPIAAWALIPTLRRLPNQPRATRRRHWNRVHRSLSSPSPTLKGDRHCRGV